MEGFIEFVADNYVWFLTITIILIFALVGYLVDTKRENTDMFKKSEQEFNEESLENLVVPEGKKLSESIQVAKNINPETRQVELNDATILKDNSGSIQN